jgi:hypothetical protein
MTGGIMILMLGVGSLIGGLISAALFNLIFKDRNHKDVKDKDK